MVSKKELVRTSDGRTLLRHGLLRSKGTKQLEYYKRESENYFPGFVERYVHGLRVQIKSDKNPIKTHDEFIDEVGFPQLALKRSEIRFLQGNLSTSKTLRPIVYDALNTDFVKMIHYILIAFFDGAEEYRKKEECSYRPIPQDIRQTIIDGHIITIDLSEPMDRVIDKERTPDVLRKYKFLCPYILKVGRKKISEGGESVLDSFERGFEKALRAEHDDEKLAKNPCSITYEKMIECYGGKYRAIMGTAASNMALNEEPIADMYYWGMGRAAEAGGCRNEIMDSRLEKKMKIPSWPHLIAHKTHDIRKAFVETRKKGRIYLEEAKIALDMLPDDFPIKPFIGELFHVLGHRIDIEYKRLFKEDYLFSNFEEQLKALKII